MIDLHLHLLPGVDDGAVVMDDALQMARALLAAGVHTVAATPHVVDWTRDIVPDRAAIARRVDALRERFDAEGLGLAVMVGGECTLSPEFLVSVRDGTAPTLGDGHYVLVELPQAHAVPYADEALGELQKLGLMAVLAHAERYRFVQADLANLAPFFRRSVGLQVSLTSLSTRAPREQRRTAEALLERGMATILATDAHTAADVAEALRALPRAADLSGAENLRLLTEENPRRILAGEPVLPCTPWTSSKGRREGVFTRFLRDALTR